MKLLPFYSSQQGGFTAGTCYVLAEFHRMGFSRSLKGLLRELASSKAAVLPSSAKRQRLGACCLPVSLAELQLK